MGYGVHRMRGDPGFGSFLSGIAKRATGVLRHIPGPQGALLGAIHSRIPSGSGRTRGAPAAPGGSFPGRSMANVGGSYGTTVTPSGKVKRIRKDGKPWKDPRMNVGNARALRRAIRRQEGFVKLAKRALKGTKYTITTRGASRPRHVTVRESGPGSVTVR